MNRLNTTEFTIYKHLAVCNICGTQPMTFNHAKRHSTMQSHVSRIVKKQPLKNVKRGGVNYVSLNSGARETEVGDATMPQLSPSPDFKYLTFDELAVQLYSDSSSFNDMNDPPSTHDELPWPCEFDPWRFDEEHLSFYDIQGSESTNYVIPNDIPHPAVPSSSEWAPYPSKGMCLTDILFSSPRLRFSEAQKRAVLNWGKELGASDVPSLYALEKFQNSHLNEIGNPTTEKRSRVGKVFYANDIGAAFANDFANPLVRPHLTLYPEQDGTKRISQLWHGEKWRNQLSEDMLAPMAIHPTSEKHFYRNELTQCYDGSYFIPNRWFSKGDGKVWATGFSARHTEAGLLSVTREPAERALEDLCYTYDNLISMQEIRFDIDSSELGSLMPNPLRVKAGKRPLYHLFAIIFIDDVSGNISKQWNKHYVCYISNANLPREQLDKEYNVRFVSSSPHLNAMELAQGISESLQNAHRGVTAYDCIRREECVLDIFPMFVAADNPMHAEICSHAGLTGNFFCRTCYVGGTQEVKRSDEGYLTLFKSGILRTPLATRDSIFKQFMRALQPNSQTALEKMVRESGVKDVIAQPILETLRQLSNELYSSSTAAHLDIQATLNDKLREVKATGSIQNAFLGMKGFDVHLDTPTEILHTILLGLVKYFWGQTVFLIINSKRFDIFQARLESLSPGGLNIPRIMANYLCQYRGSLIGKHFKSIVQVLPMIIHDLVHPDLLHVWLLLGRLMVLCWHTEINDIDQYIATLDSVIDQLLTKTAICAPSIIISKPKFHFLTHLGFYIRRFGPALLFATERYESFNSVFRQTCVHSNRMAPSRDTATTFAHLERVKHIVSGGWWFNKAADSYIRASPRVLHFISQMPDFAHLAGIHLERKILPGTITRYPGPNATTTKTRLTQKFKDLAIAKIPSLTGLYPGSTAVERLKTIAAPNSDTIEVKSAVILNVSPSRQVGLVVEILLAGVSGARETLVVQLFEFGAERHSLLDLPTITLTSSYLAVHIEDVLCVVNIHHDCPKFQCDVSGTAKVMQERQETNLTKSVVAHKEQQHFILNTLALHNHRIIEAVLPPSIAQPRTYYDNMAAHHDIRVAMAGKLRDKKSQAREREEEKARDIALGRAQIVDNNNQTSPNESVATTRRIPVSRPGLKGKKASTGPVAPYESLNQPESVISHHSSATVSHCGTTQSAPPQPLMNTTNLPQSHAAAGYNFSWPVPYSEYIQPASFNGGYHGHSNPDITLGYVPLSFPPPTYPSPLNYYNSHPFTVSQPGPSNSPLSYGQAPGGPLALPNVNSVLQNTTSPDILMRTSAEPNSPAFPPPFAAPKKATRKSKASRISVSTSDVQPPSKKPRIIARTKLSKAQLDENEQTLRDELFA